MTAYIALIRKDRGSDFGINFPDFPGCITAGRTLDEALVMAREALAMHIRGMIEDGDAVPEPSGLDAVMADPENADGVAVLVEAPEPRPVIERVNITLDKRLLKAIDAGAAAEGMTRSGFIALAARRALGAGDAASGGRSRGARAGRRRRSAASGKTAKAS
jgi:predicted RNase H-like HicB family nuclease